MKEEKEEKIRIQATKKEEKKERKKIKRNKKISMNNYVKRNTFFIFYHDSMCVCVSLPHLFLLHTNTYYKKGEVLKEEEKYFN